MSHEVAMPGSSICRIKHASTIARYLSLIASADKPRLPPGSPCTNCGKCCTKPSLMGTLMATGEDVKRWRREGRQDILRFAHLLGSRNDPWADLWIDSQAPDHRDPERYRCPFVRKVRGQPRY